MLSCQGEGAAESRLHGGKPAGLSRKEIRQPDTAGDTGFLK